MDHRRTSERGTFLSSKHNYVSELLKNLPNKKIQLFIFSLPWDQSTLWGYFGEICLIIPIFLAYMIPNNALLMMFTSMCYYHRGFYQIFQHTVDKLATEVSAKNENCEKTICKLIRFHISVKEYVFILAIIFFD